mmetsp:Transcript_6940/g.10766  ORF Transcript_6940/g.10766 Transcript_6940/m.10766 type:complete len:272 (+) Transcript_6940:728-1543(+)
MCCILPAPFSRRARFSSLYSLGKGIPATTFGPPPCILRARTVATNTTASGVRPEYRHFIFMNFSIPMSAPNPASVTTNPSGPTIFKPIWSAIMELFPCAIFANGPACTIIGVFSSVCMRLGLIASFIRTVNAPVTPRSSAVTAFPFLSNATTILENRSRMSSRDVARARMAMISDATVISNPVVRILSFSLGPRPTIIFRIKRSLVSRTRRHVIVEGSIFSRTNRPFSSSVRCAASVFSIPSRLSLRIMMGERYAFPPRFGTSRLHSALSD